MCVYGFSEGGRVDERCRERSCVMRERKNGECWKKIGVCVGERE